MKQDREKGGWGFWSLMATVALALLPGCDRTAEKTETWQVEHAHMAELPPGQSRGAVYLVLRNHGASDRQILNLEASIAGHAEVHQHIHEDGLMKMRAVAHTLVSAKGQITFAPGGYHIMLFDIAESPAVGSQFKLTIEFDGGERLTFPVDVVSLN